MRKNISQKSINEYLKKVRRAMSASGRPEQLYLRRLQNRLTEYAGAHPVESFDSLVEQFGTPEDAALACYKNAGDDLLLRRLSFRKLLFGTIFFAAFCLFSSSVYSHCIKQYAINCLRNHHGPTIVLPPAKRSTIEYGPGTDSDISPDDSSGTKNYTPPENRFGSQNGYGDVKNRSEHVLER